jgi:carbohydrate-selective porin OprB
MRIPWALLSLGILACGSAARAGAPQPFSDNLFLDWDELRSALREDGIDFRVGYISETATTSGAAMRSSGATPINGHSPQRSI